MTTKEKHKIEVSKLKDLEDKLATGIAETGNSELMNAYLNWSDQRNRCNELYLDFLEEIVNQKI